MVRQDELLTEEERRRKLSIMDAPLGQPEQPSIGKPVIAAPSVSRGLNVPKVGSPSLDAAKEEQNRLQSSPSGIAQIGNPILRGIARGLEIGGNLLLPKRMGMIPGTEQHHRQLVADAGDRVKGEEDVLRSESQTAHAQAQTESLLNPPTKTDMSVTPFEVWHQANPDKDVLEFMKQEAQAKDTKNAPQKSPEQQAFEYHVQRGDSPAQAYEKIKPKQFQAPGSGPQKAPPGYRYTASGDLESIPGGPADEKKQAKAAQAANSATGAISNFDRLATAANEVLNHPGLGGITGMAGSFPNIPGGAAAGARAKLETLKSQVAFGVLQDMRNQSKTGGALGAISEKELMLLQGNLAALDTAQSLEEFQTALRKIITYAEEAKERVRGAGTQAAPDTNGDAVDEYERDPVTKKLRLVKKAK